MSREGPSETSDETDSVTDKDIIGPLVFAVATVAMLVFFWWLLIYDHGVVSVH